MSGQVIQGDCAVVLPTLPEKFARLIYIDPPFNTGKDRVGDAGSYRDSYDDFEGFLMPKIKESLRCLTPDGSIFVHLDYREVHYVKVALDKLLGRDKFLNEIIWLFDYGGRPTTYWPRKHNTILWYVLDPKNYVFNYDAIDRVPYMAPGLVGPEKAARGKTLTDCWWNTIVHTTGSERTDYPSQKPLKIIERIVKVHSDPGDVVLDYFAGSGTTGVAALEHGRKFVMIDDNPAAIKTMRKRFEGRPVEFSIPTS